MGEPTRAKYYAPWLVPHGKHLRKRIKRGKHLLLHFPKLWSDSSLAALVNRLKGELPENFEVFDGCAMGHWKRVTVMEVIPREEVLALAPVLLDAARKFRADANSLAYKFAEINGVSISELSNWNRKLTAFPEGWEVFRHGFHYCFSHGTTGQVIEVCFIFGTEFGVLDPYFFYQYMATTQGIDTPKQIVEPYHDTRRAMALLEATGSLKTINCNEGGAGFGVFAP